MCRKPRFPAISTEPSNRHPRHGAPFLIIMRANWSRSISLRCPRSGSRSYFGFIVLRHDRRQVVHFNVTSHPTAAWTAQQIVEAFPFDTAPNYLLRDRDSVYGNAFRNQMTAMDIEEVLNAPRSPWQNAYSERLIGSIRRECLDHVIVADASSLRRLLKSYTDYYHRSRTHLSLERTHPFHDR